MKSESLKKNCVAYNNNRKVDLPKRLFKNHSQHFKNGNILS